MLLALEVASSIPCVGQNGDNHIFVCMCLSLLVCGGICILQRVYHLCACVRANQSPISCFCSILASCVRKERPCHERTLISCNRKQCSVSFFHTLSFHLKLFTINHTYKRLFRQHVTVLQVSSKRLQEKCKSEEETRTPQFLVCIEMFLSVLTCLPWQAALRRRKRCRALSSLALEGMGMLPSPCMPASGCIFFHTLL